MPVNEIFALLEQEYTSLVDLDYVDSECKRLYRLLEDQAYSITEPNPPSGIPNTSPYVKPPKQSLRKIRKKRMVYPGTNWLV